MQADGPKHERETIIRFDEETDNVEIWTASQGIYRKCLKLGFDCFEDDERHAIFRTNAKNIRLVRGIRLTEDQRRAKAERMRLNVKKPISNA